MRTLRRFVAALFLAVVVTASAYAQVLNGSIVGQVLDTTDAGVPGATVQLTHRETNQSRMTATNASGEYTFQSLPGGSYDIAITKEGFQAFHAQSVALTAGQV